MPIVQTRETSRSDPVEETKEIERLALRLLATREHSRLELMRKIAARGFRAEDASAVLDQLERENALNEARLAERYIDERIGKGFGPARIRSELREKGLADALIERHLEPMQDAWPACMTKAHDRRFGASVPADRADYARRARFLEQRGFPADAIRRFLRFPD